METKHGVSPSARQRDAVDASGSVTSFSVEERGSRALCKVAGVSHRKNISARLCTKKVGGGLCTRGGVFAGHYGICMCILYGGCVCVHIYTYIPFRYHPR